MSWKKRDKKIVTWSYTFYDCPFCKNGDVVKVNIYEVMYNYYGCGKNNPRGSIRDKADYIAEQRHWKYHEQLKCRRRPVVGT